MYDIRFSFRFDNPFDGDINKDMLRKLIEQIQNNTDNFVEIDWLNTSRFCVLYSNVETIFGDKPINNYCSSLIEEVKNTISVVDNITDTLRNWCSSQSISNNTSKYVKDNDESNSYYSESDGLVEGAPLYVSPPSQNAASSFSLGLNYDISNNKSLTFSDVCALCVNIARTKLISDSQPKNEALQILERNRRKILISEITRYKNNKLINSYIDDDITKYSIEQLETCLDQCKKYQEHFKIMELFKRSFNASGTIYNMAFPNGVKMGNKILNFKGIGKELLSTIFDPTTTNGIAFSNILSKNNVQVSDELLTFVAFTEIVINNVKIKDVTSKYEDDRRDNIDNIVYNIQNDDKIEQLTDYYSDTASND